MAAFIAAGCNNSSENIEGESNDNKDLIQITQQQFESDSMITGEENVAYFEDVVKCNGYISASSNGMAQISTPVSGIVVSVKCCLGDYVNTGQTLCILYSNELLAIQQDYAETSARLIRLKSEYERSKALYDEKIGTEKEYIAAESEYRSMKAKYSALKIRLSELKLDVSKIEDGEFYDSYHVTALINGYITSHNIVLGQFIEQQKNLLEIVDVNKLQLKLSVFESDINKLEPGQSVQFNSLGQPDNIHNAALISIGKTINQETKTIQCIAKIKNEPKVNFINHSFVECQIIMDKTKANALPGEAIFKSGKDYYVFVVEKSDSQNYYLRKKNITIGRSSGKFTEIIESEGLGKVLIKGGYNIQTE